MQAIVVWGEFRCSTVTLDGQLIGLLRLRMLIEASSRVPQFTLAVRQTAVGGRGVRRLLDALASQFDSALVRQSRLPPLA